MSTVATDTQRNRRPGRIHVTTVRRMRRITPRMVRLTLGGDDLSGFSSNGSDQHVALYFYEPGVELPRPFTTDAARALLPTAKPRLRRYTIRDHRPELHEVDMDFVLHGPDQLASGWAETVRPGDEVIWFGPSPAYPVAPVTDWTLLLGDETALPAIGAILEELPRATASWPPSRSPTMARNNPSPPGPTPPSPGSTATTATTANSSATTPPPSNSRTGRGACGAARSAASCGTCATISSTPAASTAPTPI